MQIVVCSTRKGGSGKTSLAVHLAAEWAQGRRTLLLDLDEQGDASAWLGVEASGQLLAQALLGQRGLAGAIVSTSSRVDLAPGGEEIGYVANSVAPEAVRRAVDGVADRYDAVVIDCPPSLSRLVRSAWRVPGARVLVPVDSPAALNGAARLMRSLREAELPTEGVSVVLVRHDPRRLLDRALEAQARALYGSAVLRATVRESVVVSESAGWRRTVYTHAPAHPVAGDLRSVAQEVTRG
jgi:chromosome partitioning protein